MGIEVMKYGDRIPADPNTSLDRLVSEHGADSVLVDGRTVAAIRAAEAAAQVEVEAAALGALGVETPPPFAGEQGEPGTPPDDPAATDAAPAVVNTDNAAQE